MKSFQVTSQGGTIAEGIILNSGKVVLEWLHNSSMVVFESADSLEASPQILSSKEYSIEWADN